MNMSASSLLNYLFLPFKYIAIGFIAVLKGIVSFIKYICLGSYYVLLYSIIKPLTWIKNGLQTVVYSLTPKQVKKEKELKLSVNFDENGEIIVDNEKSIVSQMKANEKRIMSMSDAIKRQQKNQKIDEKKKKKLNAERDSLLSIINDGNEKRLDKPQTFRYKALSPEGKIETSTFIGVSKLDIYTFLTSEGYTVFSIETSDLINFIYGQSSLSFNKKISTKDLIFYITQLSTYIKSGITLTEAMRILAKQLSKNRNLKRAMQSVVYYLTMGESFSAALEHQAGTFPSLVVNMIKAAEATGNLEEALDDLGKYYTDINATRKQMISAVTYPAFIGVFSLTIITAIMLFVVPKFVGIYETAGAELNSLTLTVLAISQFLRNNLLTMILIFAVFIVIFIMAYKQVKTFRIATQSFIMKIPVIGKIIIYNEITIFTKTFASLLKNDVFITDSIGILSKITKNEIYKMIMVNTIENIARGEKISESFKDHWAIPDVAYYMIVTGENTGELPEMMSKVSNYYQEQHAVMVSSLKSLIEPVMIIFLAVMVGGILIAVIMPMFYLYNSISL